MIEIIVESKNRNYLRIGLIFIICLIGYGYIRSFFIHGKKAFFEAKFGEFSVAIGTLLLAGFTVYLARVEIDEGKKGTEKA